MSEILISIFLDKLIISSYFLKTKEAIAMASFVLRSYLSSRFAST